MQVGHISAVMAIEREAFSYPWAAHAYRHEVTQNKLAHYYVLCPRGPANPPPPPSGWQRVKRASHHAPNGGAERVLGYGGFWLMLGEAHISTLAVRADLRRRGFGELLLIALLDEAERLGAHQATLEARVSNVAAQALYAKCGFAPVDRRESYYTDNGEDALIMTTPGFDSDGHRTLIDARRQNLMRRLRRRYGSEEAVARS